MKPGDHGRRKETQAKILREIINGYNTAQGLKRVFCHNVPTGTPLAMAKSHYELLGLPLPDPEQLDDKRREIRDNLNSHKITTKAVDYHIRELVKEGIITKAKGRFYLNYRSRKAMDKAFELVSSMEEYEIGLALLMEVWGFMYGLLIADVIRFPIKTTRLFWEYTNEFMRIPGNLRDFVRAWGYQITDLQEELKNRYIGYFDPKKHRIEISAKI